MNDINVYLFRHGETDRNLQPERICGRSNEVGLNFTGLDQAQQIGRAGLAAGLQPDVCVASPAERTKGTAGIALEAWGLDVPLEIDDRLQELNMGDWEGCLRDEIYTPEQVAEINNDQLHFAAPNGESIYDMQTRMLAFLGSLPSRTPRPKTVAVFTHEFAIKSVIGRMQGWSVNEMRTRRLPNGSVTQIRMPENGRWEVPLLGMPAAVLARYKQS